MARGSGCGYVVDQDGCNPRPTSEPWALPFGPGPEHGAAHERTPAGGSGGVCAGPARPGETRPPRVRGPAWRRGRGAQRLSAPRPALATTRATWPRSAWPRMPVRPTPQEGARHPPPGVLAPSPSRRRAQSGRLNPWHRSCSPPVQPLPLTTAASPSSPVQGDEGHAGHLDHLEAHAGDVTHRVSLAAEPGNQHLVVLVDEVEAAVVGHEGSNLLAILDELGAHAFADGAVGLLGLDADLLEDDALAVRGPAEGVALVLRAQVRLLVALAGPAVLAPHRAQLAARADAARLARTCGAGEEATGPSGDR
eukprot:CAMPEP_0206004498 /NCGR_PEP_ID=MMETSP1464-20131121/4013_1 /ASSEMBLY_ACC=CAM_ASM_001124 /TAXON_ID=119497 /ORGANISM="Exanthemachrysis gayraliae, Strain RCC1523" /LENGTH=307 /DNA_ID=CAMNT_0053377913 /DNA_START=286 /DNA_END=1207 /DNA_ORIENTATION=+